MRIRQFDHVDGTDQSRRKDYGPRGFVDSYIETKQIFKNHL